MSRHIPIRTVGAGKGSAPRKTGDKQFRDNLAKVEFKASEKPRSFVLKVNGKVQPEETPEKED